MSRGKALALWILGGVLLLACAVGSALGEDDSARAAGAATGTVVIALAIAVGIRYAVTRSNPHERIWSPWLLLIAAGVALLPALNNIADVAEKGGAIAKCREETNPQARFDHLPPGMAAETLDAETQAQFNKILNNAGDVDFHARQIVRDGEPLGLGFVVTVGDDEDARDDFIHGFTDRAAERGAGPPYDVNVGPATGGTQVNVSTPEGNGVIVTGFAGCHAIAAVTPIGGDAMRIVSAMAEVPEP